MFFNDIESAELIRYAPLVLVPLITIMLLVAHKMPKQRTNKSHLQISIVLGLTLIFYLSDFLLGLDNSNSIYVGIKATLFLSLYYSMYLLYNPASIKEQMGAYGICISLIGLSLFLGELITGVLVVILYAAAWKLSYSVLLGTKQIAILITFFSASSIQTLNHFLHSDLLTIIHEVLPIISYTIALLVLVEYLLQIIQNTYKTTITDPLTKLFNRNHFTRCVQNSVMQDIDSYVLFIDVDNFKQINDTYGHGTGDNVLIKIAQIIMDEVKEVGIGGRYGGEELVALIVEDTDIDALTERIRIRIEEEVSFKTDQGIRQVTVSIGVAKYSDGITSDELIKQADEAMYIAKKIGKNKVVFYNSEEYSYLNQSIIKKSIPTHSAEEIINVLYRCLNARDHITGEHSLLMAEYAYKLALIHDPQNADLYYMGGLVHDLGKIAMPDDILKGSGTLTPEERALLPEHVTVGVNILKELNMPETITHIAMYHHERIDGSGYPSSFSSTEIPLAGKIAAIADTYSALIGERRYASKIETKEAIKIMREHSHLYDPIIFESLNEISSDTDSCFPIQMKMNA